MEILLIYVVEDQGLRSGCICIRL